MTREPVTVLPGEPLDAVLEQLTKAGIRWAPVMETNTSPARPVGVVSVASIMDTYHRALAQGTRRMRSLVEGTVLVEVTVTPESTLAGKTLKELRLPPQTLVVSIRRGGALIFPRADSELRSGDAVTFLTNPVIENQLRAYLAGPQAPHLTSDQEASDEPAKHTAASTAPGWMRLFRERRKPFNGQRTLAGATSDANQNGSQRD